ncbi:MAG: MTAP family purine nucleoside phosphorylase [Phycisphaerae bacterium]
MTTTLACIAGEEVYRQIRSHNLPAEPIGRRDTPFGTSGELFRVECDGAAYYLLARYGEGAGKIAPRKVASRANIYALKDLGVSEIIGWGAGGAITHSMAVGDVCVLADVMDRTYLRDKTFFENSPLGYLRQFPVFCPTLRNACIEALGELEVPRHWDCVAAVTEGPRLETPAEVRVLNALGAQVVTHTFIPEMFLARELQMCYAAVCYIVNYAETGSHHRPFRATLFNTPEDSAASRRLVLALRSVGDVMAAVCSAAADHAPTECDCTAPSAKAVRSAGFSDNWRTWFDDPS